MAPGVSAKYFSLDSLSRLTAFIYYVLGVGTPFVSCLDALTALRPTGQFRNQDRETQGKLEIWVIQHPTENSEYHRADPYVSPQWMVKTWR